VCNKGYSRGRLDRSLYTPYALLRDADIARRDLYGEFAGIVQVEIRQRASRVVMLMIVFVRDYASTLVARPMAQSACEVTPQVLLHIL
jgi:hypothetical protein